MIDLDLICICDVESTGLNPTTDEVIELGCILYSLSHNTVLQQVSTLMPVSVDVNPVEHINGISAGAASKLDGRPFQSEAIDLIESIMAYADGILAHNAPFDRSFVDRLEISTVASSVPWIDTRSVTWPRATRQRCNLVELALAYSIPVWSNHRALTDCQLLAHIIQREPDAKRLLEKELESKVWATWRTTVNDKEGQARAKAAGFRWNDKTCPANGVWSRLMHPDDIAQLPFDVVVMGADYAN